MAPDIPDPEGLKWRNDIAEEQWNHLIVPRSTFLVN